VYQATIATHTENPPVAPARHRLERTAAATAIVLLALYLHGCAGVLVAGAVGGASMAADRRTTSTIVDDQAIELKASKAVQANNEVAEQAHVSITSYNGVVLLTGQAPSAALRDTIIGAVRPIGNIQRIHNEIEIAAPIPMRDRANDTVITGRVKSALLAAKGINPLHVKVVTSDGAVYLMGIVTRAEAGFASDIVRRVEGVQRVVRIFEYQD
jgi:osmotically-inducible protein OsmY